MNLYAQCDDMCAVSGGTSCDRGGRSGSYVGDRGGSCGTSCDDCDGDRGGSSISSGDRGGRSGSYVGDRRGSCGSSLDDCGGDRGGSSISSASGGGGGDGGSSSCDSCGGDRGGSGGGNVVATTSVETYQRVEKARNRTTTELIPDSKPFEFIAHSLPGKENPHRTRTTSNEHASQRATASEQRTTKNNTTVIVHCTFLICTKLLTQANKPHQTLPTS